MRALRRSASGAPILLLSLPLLGVARLLPAYGFGLWLRLVAASLVLLLPGALVGRALRLRGVSDLETSYRLGAYAPVYVVAAPPAHVADTASNRPYSRRISVIRFFRTGDVSILDRFHAGWLVVDKRRFHVRVPWQLVYEDKLFALYHRP